MIFSGKHFTYLLFITFLLLTSTLTAGMGCYYEYSTQNIPQHIFQEVMGLVIIKTNGDPSHEKYLNTYKRGNLKFTKYKGIQIRHTLPVSKSGYAYYVKYWVTNKVDNYIQIIIDPYLDIRVWIKIGKQDIFYEYSKCTLKTEEEIDIFVLTNKTPLYSDPECYEQVKDITPPSKYGVIFHPVRFTKTSVLICKREFISHDEDYQDSKPIGWIKIRDNSNRIAIHLYRPSWD